VKRRKIAHYLLTIFQFKQYHNVNNITVRQFCALPNVQIFSLNSLFTVNVLGIMINFVECLSNF
jgi:hypothetical protein